MPEGHTIHRLAKDYATKFLGTRPHVTSPQGKFSDAAELLDTRVERACDRHG